jgi:hypothetical protein
VNGFRYSWLLFIFCLQQVYRHLSGCVWSKAISTRRTVWSISHSTACHSEVSKFRCNTLTWTSDIKLLKSHLPTISLQRSAGYVPVLPDSGQSAGAATAAGRQWMQLQGQRSQVPDTAVLQVCQVCSAPATGWRTNWLVPWNSVWWSIQ